MMLSESQKSTDSVFAEPLAEPHFDEEVTLLSARPVVPFAEIRTQSRWKRPLVFGLAMTLALLVGAAGTTLLYWGRLHNEPKIAGGSQSSSLEALPSDANGSSISGGRASVYSEDPAATAILEERSARPHSKAKSGVLPKPLAGRPVQTTSQVSRADEVVRDGSSGSEWDKQEQSRAERREEKRQRRVAERQAERNRDNFSDDLLRIREIFEGAPRP
jgi:hypothetical protein